MWATSRPARRAGRAGPRAASRSRRSSDRRVDRPRRRRRGPGSELARGAPAAGGVQLVLRGIAPGPTPAARRPRAASVRRTPGAPDRPRRAAGSGPSTQARRLTSTAASRSPRSSASTSAAQIGLELVRAARRSSAPPGAARTSEATASRSGERRLDDDPGAHRRADEMGPRDQRARRAARGGRRAATTAPTAAGSRRTPRASWRITRWPAARHAARSASHIRRSATPAWTSTIGGPEPSIVEGDARRGSVRAGAPGSTVPSRSSSGQSRPSRSSMHGPGPSPILAAGAFRCDRGHGPCRRRAACPAVPRR